MSENKFVGSFSSLDELVTYLKSRSSPGYVKVPIDILKGATVFEVPESPALDVPYPPVPDSPEERAELILKTLSKISYGRKKLASIAREAREIHDAHTAKQNEVRPKEPTSLNDNIKKVVGEINRATIDPIVTKGSGVSSECDPLKSYDHGIHVPASTIPQVPENKRIKPTTAAPDINAVQYLEAAAKHMRDRAATYDKPQGEHSMVQTVKAFNAITGRNLTEAEGWEFMLLLKQVRVFTNPAVPHKDSLEDAVAYAALLADCMLSNKE